MKNVIGNYSYDSDDRSLTADEFCELWRSRWTASFDRDRVFDAIQQSQNITMRQHGKLMGCVRLVTDGYLFTSVCEVLLHRDETDLNTFDTLMEFAYQASSTVLYYPAHGNQEEEMLRLGWEKGDGYFFKRKQPPPRLTKR